MNHEKYAVVATLNNGKQVLLEEPSYKKMEIGYRYLTDSEMEHQILLGSSAIWLTSPIHKTIEDGVTIVFTVIEATPIVLHRFKA